MSGDRPLTVPQFLAEYGSKADTAAKRKALSQGRVPASLVGPLEEAIAVSGIPLKQTAKGWGTQAIFDEIRAELARGKGKRAA